MYKKRKENTMSKQLLIRYVLLVISTLCSFLSCPDVDCPDAINNLFG